MVVVIMHSSGGQIIIIIIIILFSFVDKQGTGSSPVCYSSVPSRFNMDECHLETKQSKGQKNKPRNSLMFCLSLSITSPLFFLYLSFQTDQTWASDYQRHQNKRTEDVYILFFLEKTLVIVSRIIVSQNLSNIEKINETIYLE